MHKRLSIEEWKETFKRPKKPTDPNEQSSNYRSDHPSCFLPLSLSLYRSIALSFIHFYFFNLFPSEINQNKSKHKMKLASNLASAAFLLIFMCFFQNTNAFYVFMTGGERKCFSKELSKDTLLNGKYILQAYDAAIDGYRDASVNELGIMLDVEEVFDDNHRVVHQKGAASGEFTFVALESGEHKICFQAQSSGWIAKVKTKLDVSFEVGSDIKQLDSKLKGTQKTLQNKVNILHAKVSEIKREQALVREREATFRDISESVNSNVMFWFVIQIIVLGLTCFWQLKHLKGFFVKQKIL